MKLDEGDFVDLKPCGIQDLTAWQELWEMDALLSSY